MDWVTALIAAGVGYLTGSISFARIIMRVVAPGQELTGIEFGEPGEQRHVDAISGTAVSMTLGPKYGGLTAILDILKVALPALAFRLLFPDQPYFLISAALGLIGHNWPIYYRFRGGRGLSAIYAGYLVLDFWGTLITAVVGMLLGVVVLKMVYVSYLAGLWLMIPWIWFRTHNLAYLGYVLYTNAVFVLVLVPEIKKTMQERQEGKDKGFSDSMDITPMGKMITRLATRLGLLRKQ
ncbi:MAG: glycerol-3-phosphate acyltransferase [Anaerolineae bacterium]|nr:glycerol-3-phosphate acyltransferase [Anaerolineae bacterium]